MPRQLKILPGSYCQIPSPGQVGVPAAEVVANWRLQQRPSIDEEGTVW